MRKYKVIVWGVGSVGKYAIRTIFEKKSLELVAAIDANPSIVGKDIGEVLGMDPTGVIVSDDISAELSKEADIVLLYVGIRAPAIDLIFQALNAKKNVLTTLNVYNYQDTAPELYEKINACALENNVTYCQQGIYPGLFTPYLPVVLASMTGRVDKVEINCIEDDMGNPSEWVKVFGYGHDPKTFDPSIFTSLFSSYYGPTVKEVARRCHLEYDEYVEECETFTHDKVIHTKYLGDVNPGTIAYHKVSMMCKKDGKEVSGFHITHKIGREQSPIQENENSIVIYGDPNLKVTIDGLISLKPADSDDSVFVAGGKPFATSTSPSINLINTVVEAAPGWVDALDLKAAQPIA